MAGLGVHARLWKPWALFESIFHQQRISPISKNEMRVATHKRRRRAGFAWLEVLLALAFIALLFQVFPALWLGTLDVVDVRNWSRTTWFVLNVAGVVGLLVYKSWPDMREAWNDRRKRIAKKRKQAEQVRKRDEREARQFKKIRRY